MQQLVNKLTSVESLTKLLEETFQTTEVDMILQDNQNTGNEDNNVRKEQLQKMVALILKASSSAIDRVGFFSLVDSCEEQVYRNFFALSWLFEGDTWLSLTWDAKGKLDMRSSHSVEFV